MEFTAANLEYAVSVFYNCEANERVQAHHWLNTAQRCPEAWSFVWELLQHHKGTEVQFFAATTLHTKLLRCWNEVPPESQDELKNKILEAIHAYARGPKIVLNRLCISLAAYILQQGATDLATILRPLSGPENLSVLLEILTVIPEEFNSMTMGAALRKRTQSALQQASPAVLDDMLRHLQSASENLALTEEQIQLWSKASSCVTSWLLLGGEGYLESNPEATNLSDCLPLCEALLRVVHRITTSQPVLSESGLEACEAALGAVRTAAAAPPEVALQVGRMLVDLISPALLHDINHESHDEDLLASLFTCAVAIGESHTRSIARAIYKEPQTHDSSARQLVELLLICQGAPGHYPLHETRSSLTFGFWHMLQDEEAYLTGMRSIFSRLLNILIEKSRAPDEASLGSDEEELLRRYRQDISDTVMSCWNVIHHDCWRIVESAWSCCSTDSEREAVLHAFLALSDAAVTHEGSDIIRMFERATQAASTSSDPRYLETSLECLGTYASWLGSTCPSGGTLARAALQAAGGALPRAPARAALALRKLSAECGQHVEPIAGQIVDAALSARGRYDAWVTRQLLGAAGAAVCAAGEPRATALLNKLADSIVHDLTAEGEDIERLREKSAARGAVEAATMLLSSLAERPALVAALLARLLPTLPPLCAHPPQVPVVFQLLKQSVQVLMEDCLPVVSELSALALRALHTAPCSAGTDVIRLMVLVLGSDWEGSGALLRACVEICVRTCVATELPAVADVAEGLFAALTSIVKKKPQYLDCLGELLPQAVELGCLCVPLWEGAARSACVWLAALAAARPADMRDRAPQLVAATVACIGGATPRNQVEPLADLLLALNRAPWSPEDRAASGDLAGWLRCALQPGDFPSHHASDTHKQQFIAAIIKNKRSRRRVLETVREFSLVCRGLIGTEYARQTLNSRQLVS